jgi:hypothetical protein
MEGNLLANQMSIIFTRRTLLHAFATILMISVVLEFYRGPAFHED